MSPPLPRRGRAAPLVLFLVGQLALAGVLAAAVAVRHQQIERRLDLPPLRAEPLDLGPLYDYDVMVSDDELTRVLRRIRPRFYGSDTRIGHVDHNLRFWGHQAVFGDPQFVSGQDLRELLLDHRRFAALYGPEMPPLLLEVPGGGVRVREFEGKGSASHDDHTMACLAEVGTPLAYPVITPTRATTFRSLVEQSLRDFSLNQVEYEWSTVTYALFVQSNRWVTSEGQEVTFDTLADRVMRQQMPQGVCMGNHRIHALVLLLRADEAWVSHPHAADAATMLSPAKRAEVLAYLNEQTVRLVQHQHADGFWNGSWPTAAPTSSRPTDADGDDMPSRIISTGHALEWWALAPEELHPPRHVLVDAAKWIVRTVDHLTDAEVKDYEPFLSHAGRALALWRGKFPHQVDLSTPAEPTSSL